MSSSDSADALRLDRDLPTTANDIAVLRRLRNGPALGFEEYVRGLAALEMPSIDRLRSRPRPAGAPFDLLASAGKPRPNHAVYLGVLRAMTPEQRLRKAFELGVSARALFEHGLRQRFPALDPMELRRLVRERLDRCHNRNY